MNKYYLSLVIMLIPVLGFAQSTNITTAFHGSVKKADKYYDQFAYRNALNIYLHANDRDPKNIHVRERIADCYFKLHDPVNAEKWFKELMNEPDIHPEPKFEYAEALSMNGKYAESKFWFEEYLKDRPNDQLALEKVAFLNKIHLFREDSLRFVLALAPFNSTHADYGAHYFHEGIVFASSRDVDAFIKHKPFDTVDEDESSLNLFYVERTVTGEWGDVVHFHREHIKSFLHEGPIAFYDNDNKGAFTKSNLKNGKAVYDASGRANLNIYFADVNELGSFTNITSFEHNSDAYSSAHPTLSRDGKTMYFSSTSPAGFGDSDIYVTTLEDGKWTEPKNLGPNINTREDESFPFLANDSTLYFSSNGHGTLGGLDILVSYKKDGQFMKARNFGGPLNTRFDDFSFVCDSTGRVGFIASNRPGGKGIDDIYLFIANYYFLVGDVRELGKRTGIADAKVSAYDADGNLMESTVTDSDGSFLMYLPYDKEVKIVAEKEGFEVLADQLISTVGKPFGVDSLDMQLWKQNMFAKGRVFSNETEAVLPGASVILVNQTDNRTDTLQVNESGEYNFLVRPDKNYRVEASKDGFITKGFDLKTKGLLEGDLLNDIVLEEEFLSKEVIHFAFDKSIISSEDKMKLDGIVKILKGTSTASLSVTAHADSRGTHKYNKALSERRAAAVVNYVSSKGINRKRIESIAFGEELLLNTCSDGVECAEEEHAKNRRAEIKVQRTPIK
jgi:outer membrane protein OmpA-like peptidoglycan-associated protein/tetratricopeptide (TPR) repeat protein